MIGMSRLSFRGLAPTVTESVTTLPAATHPLISRLDNARVDANVDRIARLVDARGPLYLIERDETKGVAIYQRGQEVGYLDNPDLVNGNYVIDESFIPDSLVEALG